MEPTSGSPSPTGPPGRMQSSLLCGRLHFRSELGHTGRTRGKGQACLDTFQSWLDRCKLEASAPKTAVMVLAKNGRRTLGPRTQVRIRLGGKYLRRKPAHRILGVELDENLNFQGHANKVAKKAGSRAGAIRTLRRSGPTGSPANRPPNLSDGLVGKASSWRRLRGRPCQRTP